MKIGSLFSGYGGLDMAVESVTGASTAWVSDIDKGACKILAHRYPDVPNIGDLTRVDWSAVEPADIITGGFPCQDLSHAGKGAGMTAESRSGLWSYMADAIRIIRPRLVVAENVRGLLSAEALRPVEPCSWCVGDDASLDLRALGAVLADLADIGYDASWYGLRAADVGACHGRWRCFVVAYPRRESREVPTSRQFAAVQVTSSDGDTRRVGRLLPTPRGSDTNGPGSHGDGGVDLRTAVSLLPTPAASRAGGTAEQYLDRLEVADGSRRTNCSNLDLLVEGDPSNFGQYAAAIAGWGTIIDRPAPAPVEPTGKNGAARLSPAFTEWMMGLPAGWITDVPGITRNEALKACGNGVVPQQAAAALRHMLTVSEVAA